MSRHTLLLLISCVICFSCTQPNKKFDTNGQNTVILDETILLNYLKTVTLLENEGRGLINRLNLGEELNKPQTEVFEKLIKKNSFENVSQFEATNLKISIIYRSLLVEKDNEKTRLEKMSKHNISKAEYELVQKYLQEVAEALQDIKIPDDTKSN